MDEILQSGDFVLDYGKLKARLARSAFRGRFHLSDRDIAAVAELGTERLRFQAKKILRDRIGAAFPVRDGRQTPMRGFCVFIAQHATACCCRKCLQKYYAIPTGRALTEAELDVLSEVVTRWIIERCDDIGRFPRTPELF